MPTASARARCQTITAGSRAWRKGVRRSRSDAHPFLSNHIIRTPSCVQVFVGPVCQSWYVSGTRVRSSTAVSSLISLVRAPTPLLPQSPRRIRREDPDHQVNQPPDDHDLDRQRQEHAEDAERDTEQTESDF